MIFDPIFMPEWSWNGENRVVENYSIVLNIVSNVLFYVNYVEMSEMLSGLLTAPGWTP